jgi:hypothetical protein
MYVAVPTGLDIAATKHVSKGNHDCKACVCQLHRECLLLHHVTHHASMSSCSLSSCSTCSIYNTSQVPRANTEHIYWQRAASQRPSMVTFQSRPTCVAPMAARDMQVLVRCLPARGYLHTRLFAHANSRPDTRAC